MAEKKKMHWTDPLNPFKTVPAILNVAKNELKIKKNKNKNKNKTNIPNPKQDEINKLNKHIKNASGWNKKNLEKKKKHLEKFGKSRTWSNPEGAKGEGKPSSVDHSKSTKKMHAIEKRNRERFGDAHVDKLKAKHKAWKEARRNRKKLKA